MFGRSVILKNRVEHFRFLYRSTHMQKIILIIGSLIFSATVSANDQTRLIVDLQRQVDSQQQQIDELTQLVHKLAGDSHIPERLQETAVHKEGGLEYESSVAERDHGESVESRRDSVGDMRKDRIRRGKFPAAVEIIGRHDVPVSLAIGGFVKTVAYFDSDYERDDPYFLPALLGFGFEDVDGQFSITSELSRVYLDGRTNTGLGDLRGYIEYDFRSDLTLRHAYFDWSGSYGQLKVGRYWSTFMDLRALPEGVTEPLVSGAPFARQEQIRYTAPRVNGLTFSLAVEDPSSQDVSFDESPLTHTPDIVGALEWDVARNAHLRLGAVIRDIELKNNQLDDNRTRGWGVQTSGRWKFSDNDSILAGLTYGDGIGRYMLGLDPFSGGYVAEDLKLKSRKALGGFGAYQRRISQRLRANIMAGMAKADDNIDLSPSLFENTKYFAANLFYEVTPYLMVTTEYTWGERGNLDGSDIDNQRITLGFQLF